LIYDDWKNYLHMSSPKPLYNEATPLPLKTQWALYDLRDIVPNEFWSYYPLPIQPRPGRNGSNTEVEIDVMDVEDEEETEVAEEGTELEPEEESTNAKEERLHRERSSFLEELMLQVKQTQDELSRQLFFHEEHQEIAEDSSFNAYKRMKDFSIEGDEIESDEDDMVSQLRSNAKRRRKESTDDSISDIIAAMNEEGHPKRHKSEWTKMWLNADALLGPRGTGMRNNVLPNV
jgi:hypothetical protein